MKSIWTVVGVIVVLAVLGYGGYRLYHHYHHAAPVATAMTKTQTMKTQPTTMMASPSSYIKMVAVNGFSKKIITDPKGMTLYTFANDKPAVSNCNGACAKIWPPYLAKAETGKLPANLTVIKRSDGTLQYAWKGMPLYYYVKDTKPGDVTGNGVKGVWAVAE